MGKIKIVPQNHIFFDYDGVLRTLNKMAKKGYKLKKTGYFFWTYEKCDTTNIKYTLCYFPEISEFDPKPTDNQESFIGLCEGGGWDYVAQWSKMLIFCTDKENPTPIETDESIRLNTINSSVKNSFLMAQYLLVFTALLQIGMRSYEFSSSPSSLFSNSVNLSTLLTFTLLLLAALTMIFSYRSWYKKSKKSVEAGGSCHSPSPFLSKFYNSLTLAGLLSVIFSFYLLPHVFPPFFIWVMIAMIVVFIAMPFTLKALLKKLNISAAFSRVIYFTSVIIFTFAILGVLFHIIMSSNFDTNIIRGRTPDQTITITMNSGYTYDWEVYSDPLNLKMEDFASIPDTTYSYVAETSSSIFLTKEEGAQYSLIEGISTPEINYEILDVHFMPLYDRLLEEQLSMYSYNSSREWQIADLPEFGAHTVYRLTNIAGELYHYDNFMLCYDDKIIHLSCHGFEEDLTSEQLGLIGECLSS